MKFVTKRIVALTGFCLIPFGLLSAQQRSASLELPRTFVTQNGYRNERRDFAGRSPAQPRSAARKTLLWWADRLIERTPACPCPWEGNGKTYMITYSIVYEKRPDHY